MFFRTFLWKLSRIFLDVTKTQKAECNVVYKRVASPRLFGVHPRYFWYELSKNIKVDSFGSEISADLKMSCVKFF